MRRDPARASLGVVVLSALLDLLLPSTCTGCRVPARLLCDACRGLLSGPAARVRPVPEPPGLPPTYAVAAYEGAVRAALVAHKEHAVLGLARPLGHALAGAMAVLPAPAERGVVVVPVPSTRAAVRARGHDPTLRLARVAARRLPDRPRVVRALRHVRRVADQAGLDAHARAVNVHQALAVPAGAGSMVGRPVVVVDDLTTTGATLAEAARALRAAGAEVVGAAVLAATARTGPARTPRPLAVQGPGD